MGKLVDPGVHRPTAATTRRVFRRWRRSERWPAAGRHAQADALLRRCIRRRTRLSAKGGGPHVVHGSVDRTWRRRSSTGSRPPMRRSASSSCASSVVRWPACRLTPRHTRIAKAGSWSSWSTSTTALTTPRRARGGSQTSPAALDQGDPGAYVNFVRDEGEARVRAAYPGATWDRLARSRRATTRPTSSSCNQNIPPA